MKCKRKKALDSHMVFLRPSDKNYNCLFINYFTQLYLKILQKLVHCQDSTGFLCSFCGQKYSSFSGLKFHLVKHTGQVYISRNEKCDICGKKFKCKSDLKIHSVVHTNIKGFACDLCPQEFKQKASLTGRIIFS